MCSVDAAVLSRHFRELDQLVSLCETRRNVLERRRKTERAVTHRIGHQLLHLLQLLWRWRTVVVTDDVFAHLSRTNKRAEVYSRSLFFETLKVFIERAPIDCEIESSEKVFLLLDLALVDGRDRLALACDLSRHTHHHLAHRAWIDH